MVYPRWKQAPPSSSALLDARRSVAPLANAEAHAALPAPVSGEGWRTTESLWNVVVTTASDRRRAQAVTRREEELADGFAEMRFAGFVTVSARDGEELELASSEIERASQLARLEFHRMHGEQEAAFTNTLPLCRGLR